MKLIKISAIWCPSCLIMNDIINEVANELKYDLIEYDYDFDEEEVKQYNPGKLLPVLIVENDSKEIIRIIGEKKKKEIIDIIKGSGR